MIADHGSLVWIGVMAGVASAVIAPLCLVPLSRRMRSSQLLINRSALA
jgi:hypothetical protein